MPREPLSIHAWTPQTDISAEQQSGEEDSARSAVVVESKALLGYGKRKTAQPGFLAKCNQIKVVG